MDKFKVLKMSKEDLESSIAGLVGLKPILQQQVIKGNGSDKKQGQTDAIELGNHFETAIKAMITVLGLIESKEE